MGIRRLGDWGSSACNKGWDHPGRGLRAARKEGLIKRECRHPHSNLHHPGKKIAAGVPPPAAKIIKPAEAEPDNMLFTLT